MRAIIFDFGGTLDTDGVHWLDEFTYIYNSENIISNAEDIKKAFIYAERKLALLIKKDDSLLFTLNEKINLHFEYFSENNLILFANKNEVIEKLTADCYQLSLKNIRENIPILTKLKGRYQLALVSNYYGNLRNICRELHIENLFSEIADSTEVGIRKPNWKIFQITIDKLQLKTEETYIIGDSYKNDILPGKSIGCKTILLNKNESERGSRPGIDYYISSLKELEKIVF